MNKERHPTKKRKGFCVLSLIVRSGYLRAYARQPARGPSKGLAAVVIENQWKTKVFGDHLGARLAHLGGYVGPSWGYVGPSWGYLDPAWGLCWPILTLCWPILGMLAQLGHFFRLMLGHVDPS